MGQKEGYEKGQRQGRRRVEGRKSETERKTKIERGRGRDLERLKHRDRRTDIQTDNGMGLTRAREGSRGPEVARRHYPGQRAGGSPEPAGKEAKHAHTGEICPCAKHKVRADLCLALIGTADHCQLPERPSTGTSSKSRY